MAQPVPARNIQHARRRARRSAMQALYQWQVSPLNLKEIEQQFLVDQDMTKVDLDYFHELLHSIPAELDKIDDLLQVYVDRPVDEIDPVERAILRIGTFELINRPDIPYRVVLGEAVQLAKQFGALDGHKYINGVLDKLAHQQRSVEIKADL
jgi:N utilization substance protein B